MLKYIVGVARPKYFFFEGFERIDFFNILHKANSFPSGHTQAAFTLAILVMIYFKKYHFYILCLAILMGLSRIFMTMHFPSDIFFGAYLGAIVPILLYQNIFYKKISEDFIMIKWVKASKKGTALRMNKTTKKGSARSYAQRCASNKRRKK